MKFEKEFSSQMVQEWQGAYMDYTHLREVLNNIIRFKEKKAGHEALKGFPKRKLTMYRAFSGLMGRTNSTANLSQKEEEDAILVGPVHHEGAESHFRTMFLRSGEEGAEYEEEFFKRLDGEFNKAVRFFEAKVGGVKQEAEELSKQMDALIALRIRVDKPSYGQHTDADSPSTTVVASGNGDELDEGEHMDVIQETASEDKHKKAKMDPKAFRPAPVEVLNHVKIRVDPDTPISTLRSVIMNSKSEPPLSKVGLSKSEAKLRKAFIQFHQQLRLLKNYSLLNLLAFSKIMKKYDKITSRDASRIYLDMVESSYLGSCDEVNVLIGRVEAIFIKHFANGDRRKGLKSLRPTIKKEKHTTTFFLGLSTGCSIALLAAVIISIQARNLLDHEGGTQYMNNIFPLYSLFGYICLHVILYGTNTYCWRRLRVNYPFIFGSKAGAQLGFREILLLASGLSTLTLAAVLSNLDLEMDPHTRRFRTLTELAPLVLVAVVLVITLCPLNIIYRSSRFFLIRCAWHCICAPLYKVTFADFFLADQLTSQVQGIRSLQFYVCYYAMGNFRERSNKCHDNNTYRALLIVVAIIPYWCRLLQCLRRAIEEKSSMQGLNSLKYFSTVIALVMRTMYDQRGGVLWKAMAASSSGITTVYNTYWDIVVDWGLLQKKSRNRWLRDKLLISSKAVYVVAIVVNILLRLVWMQLVLDFNLPFLHRNAMVALVACLEILRRGIWNFFRLENEHFNNVENYRAFKTIPLPFYYEDNKIM